MKSEELPDDICTNFLSIALLIAVMMFVGAGIYLDWTEGNGAFAIIVCVPLEIALTFWLFKATKKLLNQIFKAVQKSFCN